MHTRRASSIRHAIVLLGITGCSQRVQPYSCSDCDIRVEFVASIGESAGGATPTDDAYLARDSRGFFWLTRTFNGSTPAVFDRHGRFIREVGRRGAGPNEYLTPWRIAPAGDSMLIVDRGNAKLAVVDTAGREARSVKVPQMTGDALPLRDGGFLIFTRQAELARLTTKRPLVVLDSSGKELSQFGKRPAFANDATIAPDKGNGVWLAHVEEYVIDHYSGEGRLIKTVVRSVPWFRPHSMSLVRKALKGKATSLLDVFTDKNGRIWTVTQEWTFPYDLFHKKSTEQRRKPLTPSENEKYLRHFVEVLDSSTGEPIAGIRIDGHVLLGFIDDQIRIPHVYAVRETRDGDLRVDVWRLTLTTHLGGTHE